MFLPIKKYFLSALALFCFVLVAEQSSSQILSKTEKKEFEKREDSLKKFAYNIVFAQEASDRFRSDSQFIKILVRTLKLKNSFYYPFDSITTISHIYSPDSAFRIFTWEMKKDEYIYFQRGAIQMRTPDGSLKLFPLHDVSSFTKNPLDSVRTPNNWIGAIYYRVVLKTFNNKKYYTLLGFDDYTVSSTKKWLEVMTFNDHNEPVFGGQYISFKEDSTIKPSQKRFNIEYKKEASVTLNYDPDMDLIVYDDLISETEEPSKKDTYVPDGDFQGFKWVDGQWVHVNKVFDFKLKDGDFPKEKTILDNNGNIDEDKLMDQSQKNQLKKDSSILKKPVKKE
ncbi:MAG: hypothetical protein JST96_05405 [Bacteroidetes bacterium]|nr:hypothetical protein [Bacteroidota bacterium]